MKEWMKPVVEELEVKDTKGGANPGKGEEVNPYTYFAEGYTS